MISVYQYRGIASNFYPVQLYNTCTGVPLQEKILDPKNSLAHPDTEFLESFSTIVGPRWQCLASLLSLTSQDIESIKRDTHGAGPSKKAFCMLQKWAASETATYGLLCERLRTLSVFRI